MFGNVEDPLEFRSAGRWLELCGPLLWGDPRGPEPANRATVAATVTQKLNGNTVEAQGMATFNTNDDEWMINVRPAPGDRFEAGPATVLAHATVTDPASFGTVDWDAAVQLQER
jgi:hypothetical protein